MKLRSRTTAVAIAAATLVTACSSDDADDAAVAVAAPASEVELVSAVEGAEVLAEAPADLVLLDVRTQEEFDAGHIDGAVVIDFRRDDFVDRVAELEREVPYVVYCRTGNRSAQATALMSELGFTDITEIEDGIVGWAGAGLPIVTG